MPLWLIGLLAWLLASICFALGLARWFRLLRDDYTGETPWEASGIDPDVEVRWKDGLVESRMARKR